MKNFIKLLSLVLVLMLSVAFVACGGKDNGKDSGGQSGSGNGSVEDKPAAVKLDETIADASLKNIVGSGKLHVTAIGQSSSVSVDSLLEAAGWTVGTGAKQYVVNNTLKASDINAGDTVIIILGTSGKGLGDAGVSQADELERAQEIVAKTGINIIAIHTGKKEYRGSSSDPIIEAVVPHAAVALVVDDGKGSGGNYDGLFTSLCGTSVPLYTYSKVSKMVASMGYLVNA